MCDPVSIMATGQMGMGVMNAQTQLAQGKSESNYYNYLADRNNDQMKEVDNTLSDNIKSTKTQEFKDITSNKQNYDQLSASQKASMAANGILADSGTYQNINEDTSHKMKLDEAAIKYNSGTSVIEQSRSALSTKNQLSAELSSNRIKASNARTSSKLNAMSTIVGGAVQAGSSYASMSKYSSGTQAGAGSLTSQDRASMRASAGYKY